MASNESTQTQPNQTNFTASLQKICESSLSLSSASSAELESASSTFCANGGAATTATPDDLVSLPSEFTLTLTSHLALNFGL